MRWSKLKQRIEAGFAPSLQGRAAVHVTRYRGADEGEAWITFDKARVHASGTLEYLRARRDGAAALRARRGDADSWQDGGIDAYNASERDADAALERAGKMELRDFNAAMFDYLNMSIDDILTSDRTIIRAIGMLDARLGKRRLRAMDMTREAPLVARMHALRQTADAPG